MAMMTPPPAAAPAAGAPAPKPGTADDAAMRERAAGALADAERAKYEAIAASAPKPKKPYTAVAVNSLIDQFNETIDELGGQDLPNVEVDLAGQDRWPDPLPAQIFVPMMALFQAVEQVEDGKFAGKYEVMADELVDDTGLRMAAGQLKRMARDAALAKAMQAPVGGPAAAPAKRGPPPTRGEMSEEDMEMMGSM